MTPTTRLRFVERVSEYPFVVRSNVLQQWFEGELMQGQQTTYREGEWRDVPLEVEERTTK